MQGDKLQQKLFDLFCRRTLWKPELVRVSCTSCLLYRSIQILLLSPSFSLFSPLPPNLKYFYLPPSRLSTSIFNHPLGLRRCNSSVPWFLQRTRLDVQITSTWCKYPPFKCFYSSLSFWDTFSHSSNLLSSFVAFHCTSPGINCWCPKKVAIWIPEAQGCNRCASDRYDGGEGTNAVRRV